MATSQRYARLTYPIHDAEGSIFDAFPILRQIPGFDKIKDEKVAAYIIYLYDKGSDLPVEIKELSMRKDAAAFEAGFRQDKDGHWPSKAQKLFDLSNDNTRQLIISYLHWHNHRDITMIHYTESMFWENTALLMRPILDKESHGALSPADAKKVLDAADTKKKLREENMAIKKDLDSLYRDVYGDNEDLLEALMKERRTTPEDIAKLKKAS